MAIKTNYFDGQSYLPQDLINQMASLLTDGVYSVSSGAFLVSSHSPANLSIDVAIGAAVKNGYYIKSDSIVNVPITANTSGYNRIDSIVLEVDTTNKVTTIKAIAGTPSSSPTAPIATANQLKIAEVSVGNNVSVINSGNITDKRVKVDILDSSLSDKANKKGDTFTGDVKVKKTDGYVKSESATDESGVAMHFDNGKGFLHLFNAALAVINGITLNSDGSIALNSRTVGKTSLNTTEQQDIEKAINEVLNAPLVKVYNSVNTVISPNIETVLPFNSEMVKTDATMHSTSSATSNLYAPKSGWYWINANIEWAVNGFGFEKKATLKVNGNQVVCTDKLGSGTTASDNVTCHVNGLYYLNSGDYAQVTAWHNYSSSAPVTNGCRFEMTYIRP